MSSKLYKILLFLGIIAVLVSVPIFYFHQSARVEEKNLEVDFLDIGQGDSILIKTPYDQNILIDGGPDDSVIKELGENLPWWDRTIDLMILTHPHDDHITGLIDVIKRYHVQKILYTGALHSAPNYLEWLNLNEEKNIPLLIIEKPQIINFGDDCYLDIIYPFDSFLNKDVMNLNNTSIVSKLICQNKSFLFTGDIEKEVEEELLNSQIDLDVDVLKACHHGSNTSNTEDFLKAVNPEITVIQVGVNNDFGHPSRRVIKRLERINSEIYRTDINGRVIVVSDGQNLKIITER